MRAAARRLAIILGVLLAVVAVGSALVGLLLGSPLDRAVATGYYLVGSLLIVLGVFAGLRGPVRPKAQAEDAGALTGLFGIGIFGGGARTATSDERADALSTTWLFLVLGVVLVLAGVIVDGQVGLT